VKNILIVDGADNCAYDVYTCSDEDFSLIFAGANQDIEFIEDFFARIGNQSASEITARLWYNPVRKKDVQGIHGTLFFGLLAKKKYYPNKRDSDLNGHGRPWRA
jgi:hypothetical protein